MLRIEWCKSRARARRWSEEVELLLEEMRRVCSFLDWQAGWWDSQAHRWDGLEVQQEEAIAAYAKRQGRLRRDMKERFTMQWAYVQQYAELGVVPEEDEESTGALLAGPESAMSFDQ